MQNCKMYKQFTAGLACGLMMMITTTAIAGNPVSQYSLLRVTGEQSNPWAVPQTPNRATGFQQIPKTRRPQHQSRQIENHKRGFRFVTPEILQSLKQQQTQTQLMTENNQRPFMPRQPVQNYGYPSPGTGFTNPLHRTPADTPAASPWSSGSDILYGGESSPFVPKEAIGGLPPFHIPPFGKNNGGNESGNTNILKETNVFNPFNFVYNRNLP